MIIIHSLIHTFVHSFIHSFNHALIHSPQPFIHSFIFACIHSLLIHSFIQSFLSSQAPAHHEASPIVPKYTELLIIIWMSMPVCLGSFVGLISTNWNPDLVVSPCVHGSEVCVQLRTKVCIRPHRPCVATRSARDVANIPCLTMPLPSTSGPKPLSSIQYIPAPISDIFMKRDNIERILLDISSSFCSCILNS